MDEQGSVLPLNVRPFLSTRESIAQQCAFELNTAAAVFHVTGCSLTVT